MLLAALRIPRRKHIMEKKNKLEIHGKDTVCAETTETPAKKKWQKPKLEDVSGKVMAQPYIRFT